MVATAEFDAAIIGAGPAGLIAGLSAAALGLEVAVIGPQAGGADRRSAALMQPSISLLRNLGLWDAIEASAEPLVAIRIVDATGALLRAPEVTFHASEIDENAFGYNVPNAVLTAALEAATDRRLTRIADPATDFAIKSDRVEIATPSGTISASLAGAADGRNSLARAAAGISVSTWTYDQTAIVTALTHARPHGGVSTEFHRRAGPLTLVPGPGLTSNLVWVEKPDEAARISALGDAAFIAELRGVIGGLLGAIKSVTPRQTFPLAGQRAASLTANRIALIGEAAHVMAPIGAQGLNLSFRDAAAFATLAAEAKAENRDPGAADSLAAYVSARRIDVGMRSSGVDALNRSLLSELAPVQFARGLGLYALATFPALRRAAMREGVASTRNLPALMRSDFNRLSTPSAAATLDDAVRPQA